MREFTIGVVAMGFVVAGVFFLRFWRDTRDRLFAFFALAFLMMSLNRLGFAFVSERDDRGDYLYWVRLVAFAIILAAIIDKNIVRRRPTDRRLSVDDTFSDKPPGPPADALDG